MNKLQYVWIWVIMSCMIFLLIWFLLWYIYPPFLLWIVGLLTLFGFCRIVGIDLDMSTIIRTSHPRWVYLLVVIFLLCIWLIKGFTHWRFFLASACFRFVLFFTPRYWFLIIVRYVIYVTVLDIYNYVEVTYSILPFIYKYVTIAVLARIADTYIYNEIERSI